VRPKVGSAGRGSRRRSNTGLYLLAGVAVAIGAAVLLLGNPFGAPTPSPSAVATLGSVVGDGTCPTAQPAPLAAGQTRTVTIKTAKGDIVLKIDGSLSPIAAGNFVALVTFHFYDGSVFHRTPTLQDGTPFVIQGGAPKPGTAEIAYTIADEQVTTTYRRGTLAMARSQLPNSQSSQFFIVLDDKSAPPLASANTYAIFGEVISGMEVADAIFQASAGAELPSNPVVMTEVTVAAGPAATASPAPTVAATVAPTEAPTAAPTATATP
jgi:cyclophilin family peptidyl-prolyl cis-trans isomerase